MTSAPCPKCHGVGFTTVVKLDSVAHEYLSCDCEKGKAMARAFGKPAQNVSVK